MFVRDAQDAPWHERCRAIADKLIAASAEIARLRAELAATKPRWRGRSLIVQRDFVIARVDLGTDGTYLPLQAGTGFKAVWERVYATEAEAKKAAEAACGVGVGDG